MIGKIEKELERNHKHASQIALDRFVLHGGLAPMVNHACAPNCGIRVNDRGAHDYIAIRLIAPGEEILIDYAMRNFRIEYFPKQCLCGSRQCRGQITGWIDLPIGKKLEYMSYAAPYLLEIDHSLIDLDQALMATQSHTFHPQNTAKR